MNYECSSAKQLLIIYHSQFIIKKMDLVHVTYYQTGKSKSINALGLRKMYDLSLVDII